VSDRGPGIPEDFRPRIFQKFAQADASDGRLSAPGTGLGLSICKAIVERLGGTIGFETELGRGTTFWLELPADGAPAAARPGGPRGLLVVESDPALAARLAEAAARNGFEPTIAAGAAEARRLLARGDFAAMSLDLELPDADGAELLRQLRREGVLSAVPAIVVTERRQDSGRFTPGSFEGVVDWLSKPLAPARFDAALRNVAAAGRAEEPMDAVRDFLRRAEPARASL